MSVCCGLFAGFLRRWSEGSYQMQCRITHARRDSGWDGLEDPAKAPAYKLLLWQ